MFRLFPEAMSVVVDHGGLDNTCSVRWTVLVIKILGVHRSYGRTRHTTLHIGRYILYLKVLVIATLPPQYVLNNNQSPRVPFMPLGWGGHRTHGQTEYGCHRVHHGLMNIGILTQVVVVEFLHTGAIQV